MRLLLPVFILLAFTGLGIAQHMNEPDSPCHDVVVTSELTDCLSKAGETQNATLNTLLLKIRQHLDKAEAAQLTAAQRSWARYRDANCEAERDLYDGGTAASPALLSCSEAMTRRRVSELHTIYDWRVLK